MKNIHLFLLPFLVLIANSINAQNDTKSHSIGIQLNPYLDSHFFNGTFIKPVFAVRYAFNFGNHFSIGPEVSGYFVRWNSDQGDMNISDLNLGGFIRYSIFPASRVKTLFRAKSILYTLSF